MLVHGAWHGGWCWRRLEPELAARGFASIATDLPVEDRSATFDDYAAVVLEAIRNTDDIVLVGHSLGGMVIPVVAARRPVRAMVFVCGVVPLLAGQEADGEPPADRPGTFDALVRHPDGSTSWPDVASATAAFYGDCSPPDAEWAFARLRRQNSTGLWSVPYPLREWPDTPCVAIAGSDDPVIGLEYSRYVCRARLGIEPVVIEGGHSPFLARPGALADLLVDSLRAT